MPRGSKNPIGACTPSSPSKALREVGVCATLEGAKAAAEAKRDTRTVSFMVNKDWTFEIMIRILFVGFVWGYFKMARI
jgi:hypothetical protein